MDSDLIRLAKQNIVAKVAVSRLAATIPGALGDVHRGSARGGPDQVRTPSKHSVAFTCLGKLVSISPDSLSR